MLVTSSIGRKYGAILTPPGNRMLTPEYKLLAPENMPPIPPSVSMLQWLGPVKDQANLGACTGFAGSEFREFINRRFEGGELVFSPLNLYWNERDHDGTVGDDNGSTGSTLFWVLTKRGVCLESEDPYKPREFRKAPTPFQVEEAAKYKLGAYHRLPDFNSLKYCLASGYCACIGFPVYSSFESSATGDSGIMPVPKSNEELVGGHEVLVYGYHDTIIQGGALLVRNSWSEYWGRKGNFLMPYKFYRDFEQSIDAMMGHLGKPW